MADDPNPNNPLDPAKGTNPDAVDATEASKRTQARGGEDNEHASSQVGMTEALDSELHINIVDQLADIRASFKEAQSAEEMQDKLEEVQELLETARDNGLPVEELAQDIRAAAEETIADNDWAADLVDVMGEKAGQSDEAAMENSAEAGGSQDASSATDGLDSAAGAKGLDAMAQHIQGQGGMQQGPGGIDGIDMDLDAGGRIGGGHVDFVFRHAQAREEMQDRFEDMRSRFQEMRGDGQRQGEDDGGSSGHWNVQGNVHQLNLDQMQSISEGGMQFGMESIMQSLSNGGDFDYSSLYENNGIQSNFQGLDNSQGCDFAQPAATAADYIDTLNNMEGSEGGFYESYSYEVTLEDGSSATCFEIVSMDGSYSLYHDAYYDLDYVTEMVDGELVYSIVDLDTGITYLESYNEATGEYSYTYTDENGVEHTMSDTEFYAEIYDYESFENIPGSESYNEAFADGATVYYEDYGDGCYSCWTDEASVYHDGEANADWIYTDNGDGTYEYSVLDVDTGILYQETYNEETGAYEYSYTDASGVTYTLSYEELTQQLDLDLSSFSTGESSGMSYDIVDAEGNVIEGATDYINPEVSVDQEGIITETYADGSTYSYSEDGDFYSYLDAESNVEYTTTMEDGEYVYQTVDHDSGITYTENYDEATGEYTYSYQNDAGETVNISSLEYQAAVFDMESFTNTEDSELYNSAFEEGSLVYMESYEDGYALSQGDIYLWHDEIYNVDSISTYDSETGEYTFTLVDHDTGNIYVDDMMGGLSMTDPAGNVSSVSWDDFNNQVYDAPSPEYVEGEYSDDCVDALGDGYMTEWVNEYGGDEIYTNLDGDISGVESGDILFISADDMSTMNYADQSADGISLEYLSDNADNLYLVTNDEDGMLEENGMYITVNDDGSISSIAENDEPEAADVVTEDDMQMDAGMMQNDSSSFSDGITS